MRTVTLKLRGERVLATKVVRINRYGNTPGATAKILSTCKVVFVGNQLDLTKESLEVIGNDYPRYMTATLERGNRIRLTRAEKQNIPARGFLFYLL